MTQLIGFVINPDTGQQIGFGNPAPGVGLLGGGVYTPDAWNQLITDKSAFSITLDSGTRNAIQWITAKDRILIGTTGSEWRMSGHSNKPITPFSFDLEPQTVWGSKDMQPLVLHEAVLFVDYVGKKLRELVYTGTNVDASGRYIAPDLLLLAEHITKSGGITTMAYQRNPASTIWATLANGDLISCAYDRDQKVVAWARHPLPLGDVVGEEIPSETEYEPTVSTDYPLLRTTTVQDDPQLPHVTAVNNLEDLEAMQNDLTGNYYLTGDIDASITSDASYNSGQGWSPIGKSVPPGTAFTGTFDGAGYTISDLTIDRDYVLGHFGLFGHISSGAKIANVTLTDVDISAGRSDVGALVGYVHSDTTTSILIQNCHSSGVVKSLHVTPLYYGGLIGWSRGTASDKTVEIYDCSSSCEINAVTRGESIQTFAFGGLIGAVKYSIIKNCFATGDVTGVASAGTHTGGFAGGIANYDGGTDGTTQVSYCYATGDVTSEDNVGGFAGTMSFSAGGYARQCYSTGSVTSSDPTSNTNHGGFAGSAAGEVTDCYARGAVTMDSGTPTGGFSGTGGTLTNCYSTGLVTSDGAVYGGFTGSGATSVRCYWDTETSGQATSGDDEVGKTTSEMKTKSTFTDWDFDDIWYMAGVTPWRDADNSTNMGANSVCVIPGSTEDEVWVTVARAINGNLVRYVERMKPRYWGTDQADCFFVDSGLTYDGEATNNFTGLEHLEGETVAILGDGAVFPTQTVADGSITLSESVSVCHIGLPFTYILKAMRFDQNVNGTSKGAIKNISSAVISFYKTLNAKHSDGTNERKINWRGEEPYTTPPSLYTGDKTVQASGGFDVSDPFEITGSDPLPCTVLCVIPNNEITGR